MKYMRPTLDLLEIHRMIKFSLLVAYIISEIPVYCRMYCISLIKGLTVNEGLFYVWFSIENNTKRMSGLNKCLV